ISVFPNPVSQQLFIDCKEHPLIADRNPGACQLWDNNGMFILEQNLADPLTTLNLSSLPEGIYILKLIRNQTTIQTFKIIKSN
ncbi:MAG TPA: T9SS type A sorting domain-containing protein, partial [Saprospiraceae bacterium]|nr:T9SS type A sorting domain-containing protein [Saprospiraceae bacterium]